MPPFNLSTEWDAVYGPGFYRAHVLGAHLFARTTLSGTQGGALQLEMISEPLENGNRKNPAPPDVKGVGRDEAGNMYKVTF